MRSFLLHIVVSVQRLHILRMRHLDSLQLTRFVELLTTTELFNDTRLIEFAFEFLNRALDVLTFFNRNDNHCIHLLSLALILARLRALRLYSATYCATLFTVVNATLVYAGRLFLFVVYVYFFAKIKR